MTGDRTFSDQEVALILRRAMEMQQEPGSRSDGLSLSELRDIAREIGVDPELVSKAANQLPSPRDGVVGRLLGGSVRQELHLVHQGVLSREQLHDLTIALRSAMQHQGRTEEVLDAVEWRTVGDFNEVAVTARSQGRSTAVHVMIDRSGVAVVTVFASVGLGAFVAAIAGSIIEPGVAGGIALMGGGLAGGALLARGIWRRTARALDRKLSRLVEAIEASFRP
jgi:hypothetical protein